MRRFVRLSCALRENSEPILYVMHYDEALSVGNPVCAHHI